MDHLKNAGAFTSKNYAIKKAPKEINLLGEKSKPEPAQHIINFPGGAVEVSRTTDGNYWAHIIISDSQHQCGQHVGEIVGSRLTSDNGVEALPDEPNIKQVAVLIKPVKEA